MGNSQLNFWSFSSIVSRNPLELPQLFKPTKMAQGDQQQFCLRWNDFQTNIVSSFKHLRDEKSFTDVTLATDGQTCKAHKMVLSAILEFMYAGEVNVAQDQLPAFLKTAERLKVKGLAEAPQTIKQE